MSDVINAIANNSTMDLNTTAIGITPDDAAEVLMDEIVKIDRSRLQDPPATVRLSEKITASSFS